MRNDDDNLESLLTQQVKELQAKVKQDRKNSPLLPRIKRFIFKYSKIARNIKFSIKKVSYYMKLFICKYKYSKRANVSMLMLATILYLNNYTPVDLITFNNSIGLSVMLIELIMGAVFLEFIKKYWF